jgi:hypothetical protein
LLAELGTLGLIRLLSEVTRRWTSVAIGLVAAVGNHPAATAIKGLLATDQAFTLDYGTI